VTPTERWGLHGADRADAADSRSAEPLFYLKEPIRIEADGMIKLPERPGLGIELDRGAIERYRHE